MIASVQERFIWMSAQRARSASLHRKAVTARLFLLRASGNRCVATVPVHARPERLPITRQSERTIHQRPIGGTSPHPLECLVHRPRLFGRRFGREVVTIDKLEARMFRMKASSSLQYLFVAPLLNLVTGQSFKTYVDDPWRVARQLRVCLDQLRLNVPRLLIYRFVGEARPSCHDRQVEVIDEVRVRRILEAKNGNHAVVAAVAAGQELVEHGARMKQVPRLQRFLYWSEV